MPRKPRLNVPGAVYHVVSRCLEHYSVFCDDEDRERFLSLLGLYIVQTEAHCYAWVLMDNHYHLVLRLGDIARQSISLSPVGLQVTVPAYGCVVLTNTTAHGERLRG